MIMLKLYYSPGACSLAVHIALLENNIPHELIKVDLQSHKTESGVEFSTVNPKNYVPTIELEEAKLTEVAAILLYIAQITGTNNNPDTNDPFASYRLQEALTFVSSELHKSMGVFFNKTAPEAYKEIMREKIIKRLNYLEELFTKHNFLVGNHFTVADAYCFIVLRWLHLINTGLKLVEWQKVFEYYNRIGEKDMVKKALETEGIKK